MMEEFMRRLALEVAGTFPVQEGETLDEYCSRARAEPVVGRRAMIAAAIGKVSDSFKAERMAKKRAWIAAARIEFSPGYRQPCIVCGKFKSIAQAHHVVPLSAQFERQFARPDQEHVWLCPNHHTIVHLILPGEDGERDPALLGRRAAGPVTECSRDEIEVLLSLVARSGRGR